MPKATMEPISPNAAEVLAGVQVTLNLDQIDLDPITDVRTGPISKDEDRKIDELAQSMFINGQLQPILVRPDGQQGKYLLVAGRRRFSAKKLIAEKTNQPVTIDAVVRDLSDDQAWSASLQENLQRKQFSPIEIAQNIMEIRRRNGWEGEDWTKHVAEFLHVSRATVSQHAKLLDLPSDIRSKIHKGVLSAQSGLDLYSVDANRRGEVLAKAEELAEAEAAEEEKKPKPKAKSAKAEAAEPEEKGKVKRKHVLEAARQTEALTQTKPRTRNEILGFFNSILESTDPYPAPIVDFCKVFVDKWVTGKVGDRSLLNKLDALAELVSDKPAKAAAKKSTSSSKVA